MIDLHHNSKFRHKTSWPQPGRGQEQQDEMVVDGSARLVDLPQILTSQMYHTWFFQKRLAEALNSELEGLTLLACFSQQKDELILSFASKEKELHIRVDLSSQVSILSFRDSFSRARKNSVDLFGELLDQQVTSVFSYLHERSFQIKFSGEFQLIFKMHGSRSNVLIAKNDRVEKIFRNNLPGDLSIRPTELDNQTELTDEVVLRLLGKKNHDIFKNQSMAPSQFCDRLNSSPFYVGLNVDQPYLKLVDTEHPSLITNDAIEASNFFADLHYRHVQLSREKGQIAQIIRKQIRQSENYVIKTQKNLHDITHQRSTEEVANLIMANLHTLKSGQTEATLEDLYAGGLIKIKLNPKLSPQKNAENFYRKSKNKKIEIQKLEDNITSKQKASNKLHNQLAALDEIERIKELRTFISKNFSSITKKEAPLPYHKFVIDGYDVLVGKNAKSNDILTQRIATKNDLWLHARDVPGSHVVIRERPGSSFPTPVIEKVAALAAWFSKRKTDSLCPVIFTPKKFVRKIKGAPAGQVVVEKEEVVMVVPLNIIS